MEENVRTKKTKIIFQKIADIVQMIKTVIHIMAVMYVKIIG